MLFRPEKEIFLKVQAMEIFPRGQSMVFVKKIEHSIMYVFLANLARKDRF